MATKKSSQTKPNRSEAAPARGPKPSVSTDQIARIAIRIADREGLPAVTMQRMAQEVGLTTMALYRYFPGKADVIARMIDSVADSSLHFRETSSRWNSRLKKWAQCCRAIYLDHPWFLEATTARRSPMGPNELAWMEAALSMLAESGLESKKRYQAFFTLIAHVRGHATFEQAGRSSGARKKWVSELAQTLQQEPGRYPTLLNVLGSGAFTENLMGAFEFGLDCILDGVRAQISSATSTGRRR
jgi:AcrR family transcriptional regulator